MTVKWARPAIATLLTVALIAALTVLSPSAPAEAVTPHALTLTRTSWDVIGLRSNVSKSGWEATTPRTFPVSRRVCNPTASTATSVTATFTLGTGLDKEIRVPAGWPTTLDLGTLAPGQCREATFGVLIGEGHTGTPKNLFGKTRTYTVAVSGGGISAASSVGKLYVERLVQQNRNSNLRIDSTACTGSTCTVLAGQTYRFTLFSKSAPNGYEQTQAMLNLPLNIVDVLDVQTRYSAPSGAQANGVYGDGCGWDHDSASPTWRSCIGPAGFAGGKVGGNLIRTTYTVRARTGLTGSETANLQALIYDLSGSSYHYNADFLTSAANKTLNTSKAADVAITMNHSGAMLRGSTGSYNIAVSNAGPDATGTTVTTLVNLPAGQGVAFAAAPNHFTGVGWSCARTSDILLTCTRTGALAAGASAPVLTAHVSLSAGAAASFTASATVSQSVADPDLSNNTANDVTTTALAGQADLVLTHASTTLALRGGTATFTVTARNDGPENVPGPLEMVYSLPSGTSFAGTPTGTDWNCVLTAVATCTRTAGLASGAAAAPLTVQVAIGQAASDPLQVLASLTSLAASPPDDPVSANNVNVAAVLRIAEADLVIDKSNPGLFIITPDAAVTLNTGVFTLKVRNAGPDAAFADTTAPIRVTDPLPTELTFVSAVGSGWNCANSAGTLTCDRTTPLAGGAEAPPITVTMSIPKGLAEGVVINSASVSGATRDPGAGNNSSDDVALLVHQTDLGITMSGPASVTAGNSGNPPGTTTEYLITVSNHGPKPASNVYWQGRTPVGAGFESILVGASGNTQVDYDTECSVPDPGLEGDITCAAGSLAAGANKVYRMRVKAVSGQTATPLANAVTTFADQVDNNLSNNTASTTTTCTGCIVAPTVSIDSGVNSLSEHATNTATYAFTTAHASGVASVITSCGAAGVKTGGTLTGTSASTSRTGTVICVFDDGFEVNGQPGTSTVTVVATQGTNNTTIAERVVTISNVAPSAALSAPDTVIKERSFELSLSGVADPSTADTAAGFSYRFDCGDGVFSDWSPTSTLQCTAPNAATTLLVKGAIRDKDDGVSTLLDSVEVIAPQPQLKLITPARTAPAGVATELITVQLQDDNGLPVLAGTGGQLLYLHSNSATGAFRSEAGASLDPAQVVVPAGSSTVSFRYLDTTAGTPTITVHDQLAVTPDTGTYIDASQVVTVTVSGAALQLLGANTDLAVGAQRLLTARVVDGSGALITAGPDASASVTFTKASGSGVVTGLATVQASNGVATLNVTATDAGPITLGANTTLLVGARSAPSLSFVIRAAAATVAPNPLSFPATPPSSSSDALDLTVSNSGDAPLTVSNLALDGAHASDFEVVAQSCTAAAVNPGTTCTVTVRFMPTATGNRSAALLLTTNVGVVSAPLTGVGSAVAAGNRAPTLSLTVLPDPPRTNDSVQASATVSDPDGDPVAVSYVWRVNGIVTQTRANSTVLTDLYNLSSAGRGDVSNLITVTATATDGNASSSVTKTVRVANSAPTAVSRTALVRVGSLGAPVEMTGSDPDDQTLHYTVTSLPATGLLQVGGHTITAGDLPYLVRQTISGVDSYPSVVTFVPDAGIARTDSFTYRVRDTDPTNPLSSTSDATLTLGIFDDPTPVAGTTSMGATTVDSGTPTLTNPLRVTVDTRDAGLYVSITDSEPRSGATPPATYSLLGVEQELHIKVGNSGGTDATANVSDPYRITFRFLSALLPPGASKDNVALTRNNVEVPACATDLSLPQLNQPCVDERIEAGGEVWITVLTLNASFWNFSVPGSADTAIVSAYQGATSAGAPNDPGAPTAPTAGTLSGFAFSASDPSATFQCRLTRAFGVTNFTAWLPCVSGATSYTITGANHADDLYTFEVRAVLAGVIDPTPARRDFVVDRSAVSVQMVTGPASPLASTSAQFTFAADKAGTVFTCMLRLQSAVPGAYLPCSSPDTRGGLTPGAAYEFNVRGTDEAGNTGAASWLFTLTAAATPPSNNSGPGVVTPPAPAAGPLPIGNERVIRIAGSGRSATAASLAMQYFKPGLPAVYIARDDDFPDALTATPLAVKDGAPILLTATGELPNSTIEALAYLSPQRIIILGGPKAVSAQVQGSLGGFAPTVTRISGSDRFGTAAGVAQMAFPGGSELAFIATGESFADALASGAAAALSDAPVLLTGKDNLPDVTLAELERLGVQHIVIVGGVQSVSAAVLAQLTAALPAAIERVSGPSRYDTAAAVSARFFPAHAPAAFLATGEQFADALTAGPISGMLGGPVLLVHPAELPSGIATEISRMQPETVVILGGQRAVSPEVERAVGQALDRR